MKGLFDRAVSICAMCSGFLLLLVCGVTFFEIVARYVFSAPTTWSIDISTYAVFWATFLGAAYCLREGGHITVDVMVRKFKPALRHGILFGVYISVGAFFGLVAWQGGVACIEAYEFGEVTMSVLRFPLYLPLSAIPLGATLVAVQALVLAGESLLRKEGSINQ